MADGRQCSGAQCGACNATMLYSNEELYYELGRHTLTLSGLAAYRCGKCGGVIYSPESVNLIQFLGHVLSLYTEGPPPEPAENSCVTSRLAAVERKLDVLREDVNGAVAAAGMRLYSEWMERYGRPMPRHDTRLTDSARRKLMPGITPSEAVGKLASYEDTGNTPGQAMELAHLYRALEVSPSEISGISRLCRETGKTE